MAKKNVGEITLKEILQKQFGDDSSRILDELNQAYQKGLQGEAFEKQVNDALKKAGKEPVDQMILSLQVVGG
jgi:hypothetical protein